MIRWPWLAFVLVAGAAIPRRGHPRSLLQTDVETISQDDISADQETSAELFIQQDKEQEADVRAVNDMVFDSQNNINDILYAKKEAEVAMEATHAVNRAEEKTREAKVAAIQKDLVDNQDVDDNYLKARSGAERKYYQSKEDIANYAVNMKKDQERRKLEAYDVFVRQWEAAKKRARDKQVRRYTEIADDQNYKLKKAGEAKETKLKAIRKKHDDAVRAAEYERTQGYRAADKKYRRETRAIFKEQREKRIEKIAGSKRDETDGTHNAITSRQV